MCCAGALEDGVEGGRGGGTSTPPLMRWYVPPTSALLCWRQGGGGGVVARPPPLEKRRRGGVVVTSRRLKQLTPGCGELSDQYHFIFEIMFYSKGTVCAQVRDSKRTPYER